MEGPEPKRLCRGKANEDNEDKVEEDPSLYKPPASVHMANLHVQALYVLVVHSYAHISAVMVCNSKFMEQFATPATSQISMLKNQEKIVAGWRAVCKSWNSVICMNWNRGKGDVLYPMFFTMDTARQPEGIEQYRKFQEQLASKMILVQGKCLSNVVCCDIYPTAAGNPHDLAHIPNGHLLEHGVLPEDISDYKCDGVMPEAMRTNLLCGFSDLLFDAITHPNLRILKVMLSHEALQRLLTMDMFSRLSRLEALFFFVTPSCQRKDRDDEVIINARARAEDRYNSPHDLFTAAARCPELKFLKVYEQPKDRWNWKSMPKRDPYVPYLESLVNNCEFLQRLYLKHLGISDADLDVIVGNVDTDWPGCPCLEVLDVEGNNVTRLPEGKGLRTLREVNLSKNPVYPGDVGNVINGEMMPNLTKINLDNPSKACFDTLNGPNDDAYDGLLISLLSHPKKLDFSMEDVTLTGAMFNPSIGLLSPKAQAVYEHWAAKGKDHINKRLERAVIMPYGDNDSPYDDNCRVALDCLGIQLVPMPSHPLDRPRKPSGEAYEDLDDSLLGETRTLAICQAIPGATFVPPMPFLLR